MPRRIAAALLGLVVALGIAVVTLALKTRSLEHALVHRVAQDPDIRQAAVRELIATSGGVWDSFADADVGRVLQPEIEGRFEDGVEIRSNNFGMREKSYALPKPRDVKRVVLLGDSYVFGFGGPAEDRMGVFLEKYLKKGTRKRDRIEVLHIGMSSWNVIAECAYLRRQLSDMAPDLVIQLTYDNDLEDVSGVRGFGEMAAYSPQAYAHGTARVACWVPFQFVEKPLEHYLDDALDWESRSRYARAEAEIARLAAALERRAARYLLLIHWRTRNSVALRELGRRLDEDQVAFVSNEFHEDRDNWVGAHNPHWNRHGHQRIAQMLYALIQERGLLPELELQTWPDADAELEKIHGGALREIAAPAKRAPPLRSYVTSPPEDDEMARQVYVGLERGGQAGAYVSLVLANAGAELVLQGDTLGRDELRGGRAHVFVEEHALGTFDLGPDATYPVTFVLPDDLAQRPCVNVRIESDDWIYGRVQDGHGISFRLREVRIR